MTEPRKKVEKQIFWKQKDQPFTWKDIKHLEFEDDDQITLCWVEPYYSENESWDGHFHAEVIRFVEETDEQYEKRVKRLEEDRKRLRENRYQNYLRLKKEFENENNS